MKCKVILKMHQKNLRYTINVFKINYKIMLHYHFEDRNSKFKQIQARNAEFRKTSIQYHIL